MLSSTMSRDLELLNAVKAEDLQSVTRLLSKTKLTKSKLLYSNKRANVNAQDNDGISALHQAALMCHVPIMQLLLDSGAQVDVRDHKGMRPVHYASWQGRPEPVSLLLQYNASVNESSSKGETPLHLACQHGHLQVAKELLRYHANPAIRSNDHKTALDLACEFGRTKVVELLLQTNRCRELLQSNAQDVLDNERTTCLHLAARNGHVELLRLLLMAGVDINRTTLRGTALHEAALHGKLEAVKLLIESGIDVSRTNSYDQTALDIVKSFTTCRAAKEMKQLLKEVINGVQARAIRNHFDPGDPECLPLKEGDLLTVLEQRSDGRWKGIVFRSNHSSMTGYFPATAVQLLLHRPASVGVMPHRSGSTLKSSIKKVSPPVVPPEHLVSHHRHSGGSFASSGYGSQPSSCGGTDRSSCSSFGLEETPLTPAPPSPSTHVLPPPRADCDYFRHGGTLPSPTRPCNVFAFPEPQHHIHRTQVVVHARGDGSSPSTPIKVSPNGYLGTPASLEDQGIDVSPGRESPGGSSSSRGSSGSSTSSTSSGAEPCCNASSRHSTSSLDSGRASAAGSEAKVPPHRLSLPGFENVLRHSYHSSSTSSLGSLERLHEEGSQHILGCNVAEMVLHGVQDGEILRAWLCSLHFEEYTNLFVQAGYDMPTISRMTPEDLTAIGVTKPAHRRKLKAEIAKLNISDGIPDHKPNSLLEWLQLLRLEDYYHGLCHQGYDTVDRVTELQWEDLEEIGIKKLGHQKKVMLAIKRVKSINNSTAGVPPPAWSPRIPEHIPLPPQRPSAVTTLPRPTSLGNGGGAGSYHQQYHSQEVAITTSRGKVSPTSDAAMAPEFKTFQQSPPKDGYLRLSNGDLRSPGSLVPHNLLCQADLIAVQVRSPNRGRSLESLDMEDSISMVSHPVFHSGPDSWYDTVSAYRQHGYDTDSELNSSHSSTDGYMHHYEPDCTATLHRPKGMVKPRPVAKIIAKTRWSEPDVTLVGENELDPKMALKTAPDYVVDGWASLESSPRHFPSRNNTNSSNGSDIYGTLKGKRTPPPPPKRTNSMRTERNAPDPDPSYQAMKDKAFATCVKGLASRFNMDTKSELQQDSQSCRIPSPAPSEDFPPPPSPLPSAMEQYEASRPVKECNGQLPKDLLGELQNGQLLLRQRRKDSADSSVSTSSSESNSLPFANENVSTIKQKVVSKPPLPNCPLEGSAMPTHRPSPNATPRKAGPSINHQGGPKLLPLQPVNSATVGASTGNGGDISKASLSSGDVIDDIEHMLANLSNQLDAMLESEMSS